MATTSSAVSECSIATTPPQYNIPNDEGPLLAICTDASRCGCSIYNGTTIQLVADRKDIADPYKGLDLTIQRIKPRIVLVSCVHKRLINFLEKRFKMYIYDIAKNEMSRIRKKPVSKVPRCEPESSTQVTWNPEAISQNNQSSINSSARFNDEISLELMSQISNDAALRPVDIDQFDFALAIVPNNWFSITSGFNRLLESELVANKGLFRQEDKIVYVSTLVSKSVDVCAIRSIGAIYAYITRYLYDNFESQTLTKEAPMNATQCSSYQAITSQAEVASFNKQIDELTRSMMPIFGIKYVDPGPVLSIDRGTIEALSIMKVSPVRNNLLFQVETDPDLLSLPTLYDLLNQCRSSQGKKHMHTLMTWPLQDSVAIRNRLDCVEFFMKVENVQLREELSLQMKNVIPLAKILNNMTSSLLHPMDMTRLYKSMLSYLTVIDTLKSLGFIDINLLQRIVNLDSPQLREANESIVKMVDFKKSREWQIVAVNPGIDEDLDTKNDVYLNLSRICQDASVKESATYRTKLGKLCSVLYLPRIGFMNSIDYSMRDELIRLQQMPEFDVILHTERSIYFKTQYMDQLDREHGDILCDLIDVQQSVQIDLQKNLLKFSETLLELMELIGELDCLMAFAEVSYKRNFSRPEIGETDTIEISGGYHPLYVEKTNMIPNDVNFFKDQGARSVRVMLITGPNSCGKTTYMKSTCLIAYMAHIGCFVPALYARIPIIDSILTRMNSANSISTGLSSFARDLHQVNYALNRATEKSLIAIDEFGTGTRARDGLHLLKGLIIYFILKDSKSPHVMITSHFTQLVNLLDLYMDHIVFKTFRVKTDLEKNSIHYEFSVMDGIGEKTLADEVAAQAGLPAKIIMRAKQIRECVQAGRPIYQRGLPASGA